MRVLSQFCVWVGVVFLGICGQAAETLIIIIIFLVSLSSPGSKWWFWRDKWNQIKFENFIK